MLETVIVFAIVVIVAVMGGRSFYRTMTGKNDGCGCSGNCHSCACKDFTKIDQGQGAEI
ncbi:MAG: FeoB-associated Cys-rich membrane protein [Deltaproteobacteria bacterium]|nr:FeoB-associated Cys-rich membrane protein [Deltaproteobacteria bacterium]